MTDPKGAGGAAAPPSPPVFEAKAMVSPPNYFVRPPLHMARPPRRLKLGFQRDAPPVRLSTDYPKPPKSAAPAAVLVPPADGVAKQITINRPERRNAFPPKTVKEMIRAFHDARDDGSVGVKMLFSEW